MAMNEPEKSARPVSALEARAGRVVQAGAIRRILVISTAFAVVALGVVYWLFFAA
jgi:hypothetical protein